MHPIINVATKAARRAGDIIVRALDRLDTIKVSEKSFNNFVTDIDKQSEKEIISLLQYAYPDYNIFAEESGQLPQTDSDYQWIIDPLDGTTNFVHGIPHFAVSIALKYQDKIEHGVVYDPFRQELFSASRGQGAQLNGRRLRIGTCRKLERALIGIGHPHQLAGSNNYEKYFALIDALTQQGISLRRMGAATLDLCYVASGRFDAYFEAGLGTWDVAAGSLIVQEAGGFASDLDGGQDFLNQGNIIVGNPNMHAALSSLLKTNA